jgi:heat shock protein HslJ
MAAEPAQIAPQGKGWMMVRGVFVAMAALVAAAFLMAGEGRAQSSFPFESELLLDVNPMPGSKRIPNMDIAANGNIVLEMWCNRVEGQVVVAADTITVVTGQATARQCPPARERADADLLAALTEVTNWRRQGSTVTLIGPKSLRFRLPTN